jgi:predicted deacylase
MSVLINSPALQRQAEVSRVLGVFGDGNGPTVVVTAGIHGNEPAGVFAVLDLLEKLQQSGKPFRGRFIGLAGNLEALGKCVRYIGHDLNRLWRRDIVEPLLSGEKPAVPDCAELVELKELYSEIKRIMAEESGPFFFIDLHTTSSSSPPFIPFDDTLTNREFVEHFPVPGILGIEEFLPGTLLSYLTRYQHVAIGYEGGRHEDVHSIAFHRAMLLLSLQHAGCISRENFPELAAEEQMLKRGAEGLEGFFEVRFRYAIQPDEGFRMLPGFKSFQPVTKRQPLAENSSGAIPSPETGRVFMPLYQPQGADGFFLIRRVARFWLELSKWLRRWRFERVLALLPGVKLAPGEAGTLTVDTRVARFLATELFHLLGYRRQVRSGTKILFSRREP